MPNSLLCYFRYTFRSLIRNRWMGAVSITTTAIAFLILGIFVMGMLNIQNISKEIESNLEMVVWLKPDTERSKVQDVQTYIENIGAITSVKLIPKEEGIKEINQNYFSSDTDLLSTLDGDNPLPDYFIVKVVNPEVIEQTAIRISGLSNVDKVDYGQDYIEKLMTIMYWMRIIGIGVIILFLCAVIFLIANTIRLAIHARKKEIEIMGFVGATKWFVRWPFILEGMILGFFGSLLAAGLLYGGYLILLTNISTYISFLPLIKDTTLLLNISLVIIAVGTVLGGMASFLSVGRYLKI